jgi:hypothetical protein
MQNKTEILIVTGNSGMIDLATNHQNRLPNKSEIIDRQ